LFLITPEELTGVGKVVQAGPSTKEALAQYPVGGLIYSSENVQSKDQLIEMIGNTKEFSKYPLFFQPLFTEWSKNGRFWSVDISVSIKVPQYIVVFGFAEFKPARVTFRLWRAP